MKLNLASGQMYMPGYINIDNKSMYYGNMNIDYEADIFTLQWDMGVVEEILLSHFAMYISLKEMPILLTRWLSWLVPDGRLIIETGNLKAIAKYILENDDPEKINSNNGVKQLFGWESTAGHKWAWCPETLGKLMYQAGFSNVEVGPGYFHQNTERDFLIVGTK